MVRLAARIGIAGLAYAVIAAPAVAQFAPPRQLALTAEVLPARRALDANGDGALRDQQSDEGISEQDAIAAAEREGIERISNVRTSGASFRISGFDNAGHDLSVLVDRRSGNVLSVDR